MAEPSKLNLEWQFALFRSLVEIKSEASRYYLGILWWICEPLVYLATLYFVFDVGLRAGLGMSFVAGDTDFVIFLLIGLVPWKWFSTTISTSTRSIEAYADLIQHVDVRKWTLIASVILSNFWKFLFLLLLLLVLLILFGYAPALRWLDLIPLIALQMVLMCGISICTAIAIPFVPDLRLVVENGLFIAFLSAGVFFDVSTWPAHTQAVLQWHPMVWFLDSYRTVLLTSDPVAWPRLIMWAGVGLVIAIIGLAILRRVERLIPRVL